MPPTPSKAEIVTSLEEFNAIGPTWDRLASRFSSPLLTHDWFYSAAATLHPHDRLSICMRTSGGEVVAAAPFVEHRRLGLRSLEFIGSSILCEPSGFIYARPADLRLVLGDVLERRLPVLVERVSDPILVAELSALHGGTVEIIRKSAAPIPWIRIDGAWEKYYGTITSKWRSAHRRAMKKAETEGRVGYSFWSPGPKEFGPLMDRFVEVEGSSWKMRLGTALRGHEPLRAFFQKFGMRAARRGILRFAFMELDGAPIAAHLAVDYANRHWLLKIGYDERFSHCSPGILLMYKALERAFNDRMEAFEFLGSNETWIQIWKHRARRYYSRSIDQVPARRALARTLILTDKVAESIRTRLARATRRK